MGDPRSKNKPAKSKSSTAPHVLAQQAKQAAAANGQQQAKAGKK